jgi:hypothetical protein
MAYLRFFRRIRLAPGLTLNLSKRGASVSVGARGAHVTLSGRGVRTTVGLPGTGVFLTNQEPWQRGHPPVATSLSSTPGQIVFPAVAVLLVVSLAVDGVEYIAKTAAGGVVIFLLGAFAAGVMVRVLPKAKSAVRFLGWQGLRVLVPSVVAGLMIAVLLP